MEQLKRVVENSGNHKVGLAVIVEIPKVATHPGYREAVFAQRHSSFESHLLERSITPIAKQKIAH